MPNELLSDVHTILNKRKRKRERSTKKQELCFVLHVHGSSKMRVLFIRDSYVVKLSYDSNMW